MMDEQYVHRRPVLHICTRSDIETAKRTGSIEVESLYTEGFIHCCFSHQLAGVLERYFPHQNGLMIIKIDPDLLNVELKLENTVGGLEQFPHIYGPINSGAIISSEEFVPDKISQCMPSSK